MNCEVLLSPCRTDRPQGRGAHIAQQRLAQLSYQRAYQSARGMLGVSGQGLLVASVDGFMDALFDLLQVHRLLLAPFSAHKKPSIELGCLVEVVGVTLPPPATNIT